jgi:hypothetical protein
MYVTIKHREPGSEGGGTSFFRTNPVIRFCLARSFIASQYFQKDDGPVYYLCVHAECTQAYDMKYPEILRNILICRAGVPRCCVAESSIGPLM